MPADIIVLDGTAASGKTSTAKALHPLIKNATVVHGDEYGISIAGKIDTSSQRFRATNQRYELIVDRLVAAKVEDRQKLFQELYLAVDQTRTIPMTIRIC